MREPAARSRDTRERLLTCIAEVLVVRGERAAATIVHRPRVP
jgi:hypothetical protein